MFSLIKWMLILTVLAGLWLTYDVYVELNPSDRYDLKSSAIESIDSGSIGPLAERFDHHIKTGLTEKLKIKLKNLLLWSL